MATFPPSRVFFDDGEQPKVLRRQVGTGGGMDQNLDDLVDHGGYRYLLALALSRWKSVLLLTHLFYHARLTSFSIVFCNEYVDFHGRICCVGSLQGE